VLKLGAFQVYWKRPLYITRLNQVRAPNQSRPTGFVL
jgi:hypothetical protein